jgi:hypothetical protein
VAQELLEILVVQVLLILLEPATAPSGPILNS